MESSDITLNAQTELCWNIKRLTVDHSQCSLYSTFGPYIENDPRHVKTDISFCIFRSKEQSMQTFLIQYLEHFLELTLCFQISMNLKKLFAGDTLTTYSRLLSLTT